MKLKLLYLAAFANGNSVPCTDDLECTNSVGYAKCLEVDSVKKCVCNIGYEMAGAKCVDSRLKEIYGKMMTFESYETVGSYLNFKRSGEKDSQGWLEPDAQNTITNPKSSLAFRVVKGISGIAGQEVTISLRVDENPKLYLVQHVDDKNVYLEVPKKDGSQINSWDVHYGLMEPFNFEDPIISLKDPASDSYITQCEDGRICVKSGGSTSAESQTWRYKGFDPCDFGQGGCNADEHETCKTNVIGDPVCGCADGYIRFPATNKCIPSNPCSVDNGGCDLISEKCRPVTTDFPKVTCSCASGYEIPEGGSKCVPEQYCPSATCWDYEPSSDTCIMKPGCTNLQCLKSSLIIEFSDALFGSGAVLSPEKQDLVSDSFDHKYVCRFGECDMVYTIDENKRLKFSVTIKHVGHSRKRRASIVLGSGLRISTEHYGTAVGFTCRYHTALTLSSDAVQFKDRSVYGEVAHDIIANLDEGFSLVLNDGKLDEAIMLGSELNVAVNWVVDWLDDLEFNLNVCSVLQGTAQVDVVNKGCFSEILQVTKGYDDSSSKKSFSFLTFSIDGQSMSNSWSQVIQCEIFICMEGLPCEKPTADEDCPNDGWMAAYKYSMAGYSVAR